MLIDHLKPLKRIPGTARLVQKVFSPQFTGAWLYTQQNVAWLSHASLKSQLPLYYRLFATYCALQRPLWPKVLGGVHVLQGLVWVAKTLNLRSKVQLDLGTYSIFLDLQDPRILEIPSELQEQTPETAILASHLHAGDTFIDVGANYGSFSIIAAKLVGPSGEIVAVEPQPRLAALIKESLNASALCPYRIYQIACGDRDGRASLFVPSGTSGNAGLFSAFSATEAHHTLSVPVRRFDEAVNWQHCPGRIFLKLDIEGSELAFLRGAGTMLRSRRPKIMFEVNPKSMRAANTTIHALVRSLLEMGYDRYVEVDAPGTRRPLQALQAARQHNVIVLPAAEE